MSPRLLHRRDRIIARVGVRSVAALGIGAAALMVQGCGAALPPASPGVTPISPVTSASPSSQVITKEPAASTGGVELPRWFYRSSVDGNLIPVGWESLTRQPEPASDPGSAVRWSPDGSRALEYNGGAPFNTTVLDADGHQLSGLEDPGPAADEGAPQWADDSAHACQLTGGAAVNGVGPAHLFLIAPGSPPRLVASLGRPEADVAMQLLSCSLTRDQALVADEVVPVEGSTQTPRYSRARLVELMHRTIRLVPLAADASSVVASNDASLLAYFSATRGGSVVVSTTTAAEDLRLANQRVRGFASDGRLLVATPNSPSNAHVAAVDVRTGAVIWSLPQAFQGLEAMPGGDALIVVHGDASAATYTLIKDHGVVDVVIGAFAP